MLDDNAAPVTDEQSPEAEVTTEATTPDQGGGTILENPSDEKVTTPADWPEDWRDKMAAGDDKLRKRLDRMKSPLDVMGSWRELEKKFSSGDTKTKLADDATDEQVAAWRKDNGIPEDAKGYYDSLPDGLVIADEDKARADDFMSLAHKFNIPPAAVGQLVNWQYAQREQELAALAESDKAYQTEQNDLLRGEWGNEYRSNVNSITAFLDTAPAAPDGTPLKDLLMGARLADGTALGNNSTALKWLAHLASEANPAGFVSPGAGTSQLSSVEDEIAGIEKVMRTNRAAYNKDEKMQARLRQLYDAQEKLASRG